MPDGLSSCLPYLPDPTMNRLIAPLLLALCVLTLAAPATAAPMHATHLGNPATRFAQPLKTPDDLRRVFARKSLQADIARVLTKSGFDGDIEDFRDAIAHASIEEIDIPVGTLLPAMSTRIKGHVVLLHDVLWAGEKPFPAYQFYFQSRGHYYRVVVPKPCSNFWLEDRKLPKLALRCVAPETVAVIHPLTVCQEVENSGDAIDPLATLTMPLPPGASLLSGTGEPSVADGVLTWTLRDLAPGASQKVCASLATSQLAEHEFTSQLNGSFDTKLESRCATRVYGIPAVLLEVVDLKDPVEVNGEVVYEIRVLNQGSEPLTQVRITATLEDTQAFQSASGASRIAADGPTLNGDPVASLKPGEQLTWRVVVKALKAGDVRFHLDLHADQFSRPISETEATTQY
jgi:hypothetical protein